MVFLISLIISSAFILLLGKNLRKHPLPYYIGATLLTAAVIALDFAGVRYPDFLGKYIMPVITKGALSGALFVLVMWAGALPNGSRAVKTIMPIRGELSIIACILVFAHAVTFKAYIIRLFTKPGSLKGATLAAALCSALLIIIMIPLFVTSFKKIRKKMKAKTWKKLQRLAYAFYALILAHILFFTYRNVIIGREGYRFNAVIYTYVFLSYAVCRILKTVAVKKKVQETLEACQLRAVAVCATFIMFLTVVMFGSAATEASAVKVTPTPVPTQTATKEEKTPKDEAETVTESETVVETVAEKVAETAETSGFKYNNGKFTGSSFGNSGDITVQVEIKDDKIISVEILDQDEDEPYFTDALEVIPTIIEANSTDVDAVSGATFSSEGITDAVDKALKKAEK